MGRQKLLLSSSTHGFEGTWPEASLSQTDLSWARRNLIKGEDGLCNLQRDPKFQYESNKHFEEYVPILPEKWKDRVVFREGEPHPRVRLRMGRLYDIRERFQRAYDEREPDIAPHVMFRTLAPGNDALALGFMKEFGPLYLNDFDLHTNVLVDLNDFWNKHARFIAVVRLYELFDDCEALRSALADLLGNIELINAAGPAPVGCIPDPQKGQPFPEVIPLSVYEPNEYNLRGRNGDLAWNHQRLRDHARKIIWAELTLQTNEGLRSGWAIDKKEEAAKFRPVRVITSLWAAIWEMVGLESWRGHGWRACRDCGEYFYPNQVNSECCPKHQALWSKRQYAKKRRELEKLAASKKDRRTKKRT